MPPQHIDLGKFSSVKRIFHDLVPIMMKESDRGAILVGLSVIDKHLEEMFERRLPTDLSSKGKRGDLLGARGPLGSLGAKNDIARAVRLIEPEVHQCINRLRKLRNDVAHEPAAFTLANHREEVREISNLSPLIGEFLKSFIKVKTDLTIEERMRSMTYTDSVGQEKRLFETEEQIAESLANNNVLVQQLYDKGLRYQVALAVGFICASISYHEEGCSYTSRRLSAQPRSPARRLSSSARKITPAHPDTALALRQYKNVFLAAFGV